MLGWEFPPVFSGGLGVVTQQLVQHLHEKKEDVTLLLPYFIARKVSQDTKVGHYIQIPTTEEIKTFQEKYNCIAIPTTLHSPYGDVRSYEEQCFVERQQSSQFVTNIFTNYHAEDETDDMKVPYGETLFQEIDRFAQEVLVQAEGKGFDVVHAHDWITAEAALQLKLQKGIPYILQIHATEVDRTGKWENLESDIFKREQYAMQMADKVIAVSHYTKNILETVYGIDPDKIEVIHNAYEKKKHPVHELEKHWQKDKSQFWVLFIGRVTLQKGPDYFIDTAKKVIKKNKDVHFLIAGDGDMMPHVIEKTAQYGIQSNVHFLGFLNSIQRDGLYRFTDACIVPSVSEPFGLTAIEVVEHRTPLIVSRNCGANEVIPHKLEVDFFDSDQMAEYVLALQKYPALRRVLRNKAKEGIPDLSWSHQVDKMIHLYNQFK